jgi:hypothetical protein
MALIGIGSIVVGAVSLCMLAWSIRAILSGMGRSRAWDTFFWFDMAFMSGTIGLSSALAGTLWLAALRRQAPKDSDPRKPRGAPMKWEIGLACLLGAMLLGFVVPVLVVTYPRPFGPSPVTLPNIQSNMRVLQVALEIFSDTAGGYYPADINTRVKDVLGDLGKQSENLLSIAGAKDVDSVGMIDIGSMGPALLPAEYHNPYSTSRPAVTTSQSDPTTGTPGVAGLVFYVPLDVKGRVATGYRVYGVGRDGRLFNLVLSSDEYRLNHARPAEDLP